MAGNRRVGVAERRTLLADRHRLLVGRRTNDVVSIADDLVALHSTDPATVFLSVFARMAKPSVDALEGALYDKRTLIRHHAMRRTVWVGSPAIVDAMNASSTRKIAAAERRTLLKYLAATAGVDDPEEELDQLEAQTLAVVKSTGSITARRLGLEHPELARKITVGSGKFTIEAGAHTRVLSLAGFDAKIMRGRPKGSWTASEYAWSVVADWCDIDFEALDVREASATVMRLYLQRFGPATSTDAQWWTGWTKTATRNALSDIDAVEVSLDDDETGWVVPDDPLLDGKAADSPEPWVAVLPGLDPTIMGWKQRGWYLGDAALKRTFDRNGNAGPTIWCNGEVVGGWVQQKSGDLATELYRDLTGSQQKLLDTELERTAASIGDVRFKVRFPSPNQKHLLDS